MRLIVAADVQEAAQWAADEMARACTSAIESRGVACVAVSGGSTPLGMLHEFARLDLPWEAIFVAQVDERCVPLGDPRRNLAGPRRILVDQGPLPQANLLPMPVEQENLALAADAYAATLAERVGPALKLDLVHLGLGEDGHTASLVPGDPVLDVRDRDVAVTQLYQGTRRMTLTYRALSAARERLWLVFGAGKSQALADLVEGAGNAPAVRVLRDGLVIADREAAANVRSASRGDAVRRTPQP